MAFCFMQTISFLYFIIVLASTASSLRHDEAECLALFQFKQSFLHQPYASLGHKFASWRKIPSNASDHDASDSGCCSWEGVGCGKDGHVIELNLSNSSLYGPIKSTSTLFNLVHLQLLNLSMNNFVESQIPSEIACLKLLRILDLSYSGFSGQIPSEISQLVQLASLDLGGNPLKLRSPSLEYLLQNMTGLEKLHLSRVDISSSVPRFLANFSSLRSIELEDCRLQDEFPSAIFRLPKLKFLYMGNNARLVGSLPEFHNSTLLEVLSLNETQFGSIIPESIGKLTHLEVLDLANCYFSGSIPGSLSNLTQLTQLFLYVNMLTGPVPSLESLSQLKSLELSGNNFEKGRMFDWISKLTNLNDLSVAGMNIHEEIPPSIANLTKLSVAEMTGNSIFGQIPSTFLNLTTLTILDLSFNQLEGQISSAFSYFKGLKYVRLEANKFTGMVNLDTFIGLNKLEILVLGSNKISVLDTNNYTEGTVPQLFWLGLESCNLKEFPAFLRYQKNMKYIFLSGNTIEGLVPKWVWNNSLETLYRIDLSNNFITGFHQLPYFLPWVNLAFFFMSYNRLQGRIPIPPQTTIAYDVSNNSLTGEIPPLICEVKSLRYLDLSSNHMIGSLPPCLGNLSKSLWVLNLNRNNFHGPMMNTFTHGSPLKKIDLSENQFTGKVSKSLANCTNLQLGILQSFKF